MAGRGKVTSCGTLVINKRGELLICHATGTRNWDIPKGLLDEGETRLEAAQRELREETGLVFDAALFEEIGERPYRKDKRLHLFLLRAPEDLDALDHLECTSFFPHRYTGKATPEADDFRWAAREEVARLCWPRMAEVLLSLDW